jgi:hypothetical protein
MAFTIESADQKQHLNLSDDAWAEIDDDRRNFSATPDLIPLATFLNKVISNFYESADASIDFQTSKYKHELEQEIDASFLKKRYSQATEQDYIAFLVNKKNRCPCPKITVLREGIWAQVPPFQRKCGASRRLERVPLL